VSVLAMDLETDAIRLVDLVVAEELRRKRVGRVMLNELAALAAKLERTWLVADMKNAEFLRRVGFVEDDGVMRRRAG
jgi:N-acetylglutamate synthase-like GNAT family acetyltransferase